MTESGIRLGRMPLPHEPRVVFVLGAGCSAADGCPTMATFFDEASRLAIQDPHGQISKDLEAVNKVRSLLVAASARVATDVNNLEFVFSTIEMASVVGGLGPLLSKELDEIRSCMVRLIVAVLDKTQQVRVHRRNVNGDDQFPITVSQAGRIEWCVPRAVAPPHYSAIASLLKRISTGNECARHSVACITFNYDCGLELAMLQHGLLPEYGILGDRLGIAEAHESITVCKLHGSMNWFMRDAKPYAHLRPLERALNAIGSPELRHGPNPSSVPTYSTVDVMARRDRHGQEEEVPYIVPPTEAKANHRQSLQNVWKFAHEELSRADVIIVIGYSMPATDQFFSQLLAVSSVSAKIPRGFWVFDKNPGIGAKYLALLGSAVQARFKHYVSGAEAVSAVFSSVLKDNKQLVCRGPSENYAE